MGRISMNDKRYKMLLKCPKIKQGSIVFRKKPSHVHKYIVAVFDAEDGIHYVLYQIQTIRNPRGDKVLSVAFTDYVRS